MCLGSQGDYIRQRTRCRPRHPSRSIMVKSGARCRGGARVDLEEGEANGGEHDGMRPARIATALEVVEAEFVSQLAIRPFTTRRRESRRRRPSRGVPGRRGRRHWCRGRRRRRRPWSPTPAYCTVRTGAKATRHLSQSWAVGGRPTAARRSVSAVHDAFARSVRRRDDLVVFFRDRE